MLFCGGLTLAEYQMPPNAILSLPLVNWAEKKKYNKSLMGKDIDRERSFTSYHHRQNRLNLGKLA